jgi:hypothetical protein
MHRSLSPPAAVSPAGSGQSLVAFDPMKILVLKTMMILMKILVILPDLMVQILPDLLCILLLQYLLWPAYKLDFKKV